MSSYIQLDFFQTEEESEIASLHRELERVRLSSDKVRKGVFAKVGEMTKITNDLHERLNIIERHICKGSE